MAVLNNFSYDVEKAILETGMDCADALTGSILAANKKSGIVLIKHNLSNEIKRYSKDESINQYKILGGEKAVSRDVFIDLVS